MSARALRSFGRGEQAPSTYAGTDRESYQQGLRTLLNGYVQRTGGIQSRPGTVYKGTSKSSGAARLVSCVFDDDQNYVLEFGANYVRFWKDGALVQGVSIGSWANVTAYAAGIVVLHSGTYYVSLQAHTSNTANDRPNDGTNRLDYWHALVALTYELPTDYGAGILRELQFVATLGVLRIAHNTVAFQQLVRVANAQWYFAAAESAPTLAAPANMATDSPVTGTVAAWCVTAYDSVTQMESLPSDIVYSDTAPDAPGSIWTETWDAVTGATSYRVYRSDNAALFGFVWETPSLTFIDGGAQTPDLTRNPPTQQADFSSAGTYPGVVGAYQQRIFYSGSVDEPDFVRGSKTGSPDDFTVSTPLVDSDAVSWRMVNEQVVRLRHLREVGGRFWQFTNVGEGPIDGDDTGIIAPGAINPQLFSAHGAAKYPSPLKVGDAVVYVQEAGSVVRSVFADGSGGELSILGSHLVDGYTLYEAAYQKNPHGILWFVRSDGVLLSLTYVPETNVLAWARHVTDGTVESIACVKESTENAVYLLVNRTINGSTVRYVERMANRAAAVSTLVCADAAVGLTNAFPFTTLTLSNSQFDIGNNWWTYDCARSGGSGGWVGGDVGRTITFVESSVLYDWTILSYTSAATVVIRRTTVGMVGTGFVMPNWYINTGGLSHWNLNGLSHLNGEAVSITLDGVVYASPNNAAYTTRTVSGGVVVMTTPWTTAVVGLPFVMDVQTLEIDEVSSTVKESRFLVTKVGAYVQDSLGFFAGSEEPTTATGLTLPAGGSLQPVQVLDRDENTSTTPLTGYRSVNIDGRFDDNGRIFLRHLDPSPLTILALVPQGHFPRGG